MRALTKDAVALTGAADFFLIALRADELVGHEKTLARAAGLRKLGELIQTENVTQE